MLVRFLELVRCHFVIFVFVFVFAGPIQLVHCDACSTQVKPRPKGQREVRCARLYGYPCMLNMCHGAHVLALAQRNKNGSAPIHGNRMSAAASSVLLTISYSIFKVITVTKQLRMCNYTIFYGNYFDIHFQYRQKVYISEKVDMVIFFQWQYRQYRQIEILLKTIYRNTDGA